MNTLVSASSKANCHVAYWNCGEVNINSGPKYTLLTKEDKEKLKVEFIKESGEYSLILKNDYFELFRYNSKSAVDFRTVWYVIFDNKIIKSFISLGNKVVVLNDKIIYDSYESKYNLFELENCCSYKIIATDGVIHNFSMFMSSVYHIADDYVLVENPYSTKIYSFKHGIRNDTEMTITLEPYFIKKHENAHELVREFNSKYKTNKKLFLETFIFRDTEFTDTEKEIYEDIAKLL